MIPRLKDKEITENLKHFPAACILGPRQCGKTTLAKNIVSKKKGAVYLDLEDPDDRIMLSEPGLFFERNQGKLICLDEVQFMPEIFRTLRSVIDRTRRNGQLLLLGSASPDMLRQSSETLAGRIAFTELSPLSLTEVDLKNTRSLNRLWLRGGFPKSFTLPKDDISMTWRKNFIRTFLERDLSNFGVKVSPENMRKFWIMCAHLHGQVLNLSHLGAALGVSHTTVGNYVEAMTGTFMLRKLEPYFINIGKRFRKTPKLYLSDTGILHALLNLKTMDDLVTHPVAGFSWESFALNQIIEMFDDWEIFYATTADLAEIDFILKKGRRTVAVECKLSKSPQLSKGFFTLMSDLKIKEGYVVCPISSSFPLKENVTATGIASLSELLGK